MVHVRSNDIKFQETPGGNASGAMATPSRGATEVSVIRQRQQPNGNNPQHYHDHEEVLVLLAGSLNVSADGTLVDITAGDTLIIPANTVHQLTNKGNSQAEWLIISPRGVRFFGADGTEMSPTWSQ